MFGYVVPEHSQLGEDDKKTYRGYYCGVCHSIAKRFGQFPRVTLTYDMAFLAVFLSSLLECEQAVTYGSCLPHPLHKDFYFSGHAVDYAADMNVYLAYEKMMDDWIDDRSIGGRSCALLLKHPAAEVSVRYPEQTTRIHDLLVLLRKKEKASSNIDVTAGIFASILQEVFDYPGIPCFFKDKVQCFAANLGRYIYLLDAYCDLEQDKKKNRYNPLLVNGNALLSEESIKEVLLGYIGEACLQFELLPITDHMELIRNILYCGVWSGFYQKKRKGLKNE